MGLITGALFRGLWGALAKVPLWLWLVLALVVWNWHGRKQLAALQEQALAAQLQASEDARETERLASRANTRIADELLKTQRSLAAASRASAERLRKRAEASTGDAARDAALAACRSDEGPAVRVLSDETREALVELAADADAVTSQLVAAQAYIRDVCRLGQ